MLSVATPEQVVLGEATSALHLGDLHPQGPTGDLGPFHRVQQAGRGENPCQSINQPCYHSSLQEFSPNQNRMAPSGTCVAPGFITG